MTHSSTYYRGHDLEIYHHNELLHMLMHKINFSVSELHITLFIVDMKETNIM